MIVWPQLANVQVCSSLQMMEAVANLSGTLKLTGSSDISTR
jgi:hypothetical protein